MATNPFTSATVSGYNNNPPPDDGTESTANEITWAKHKTKLGDPLKTAIEDTNTQVSSAFDSVPNLDADEINTFGGNIGFNTSELTISGGSITPTKGRHTVDTQNAAATDDLDVIATSNFADGGLLVLSAENESRTVVVKHESSPSGNIHLAGMDDFDLDDTKKSLLLQRRGTDWYEANNTFDSTPVGSVTMWAGDESGGPPSGWLLCDGSAVSRSTFDRLFSAIGTTFGSGDGSTTFNIPNFRGHSPLGVNNANLPNGANGSLSTRNLGSGGGDENLQSHTHSENLNIAVRTDTGSSTSTVAAGGAGAATHTQDVGGSISSAGSGSGGNMHPFTVINFLIKT